MKKKILIVALFFCLSTAISSFANENKVIYMISTPRALSTAFLRMMTHRGDFQTFNEPSIKSFSLKHLGDAAKGMFENLDFVDPKEIMAHLESLRERGDVFVKDMSISMGPFLYDETQKLVKNPNVHFVFLVRNPHHYILSFYHKQQVIHPMFDHLMDLKQVYEHFTYLQERSPNPVKVLFSEDLYLDPDNTIQAFCEHYGIPYKEEFLHWSAMKAEVVSKKWNEPKKKEFLQFWHDKAISSTSFVQPAQYAVGQDGEPTFEEVAKKQDKEKVRQAYYRNLPYYKKFKNLDSAFLVNR